MNSHFVVFLLFTITLCASVHANHVNCTTPSCRDVCSFHGEWVNDSYCQCDDMYYTVESHEGHHNDVADDDVSGGLTNHLTIPCGQRRKSQLTAFVLHNPLLAVFGSQHWYIGNVRNAIGYIILSWFAGMFLLVAKTCRLPEKDSDWFLYFSKVCAVTIGVWYIVDVILLATNYYTDAHGEALYQW
jgi:hypothetical protein